MNSPTPHNRDEVRSQALNILKNGGIVVMPTDTIYGIVASALLPEAVEKVFTLRKRDLNKPVIILIADFSDLALFAITPSDDLQKFLASVWPGAVSVVVPATAFSPYYLHRGTNTIASRLPNDESLRAFLRQSGPLIAPSANISRLPPATTVTEARHYFGKEVALYVDGGTLIGQPSTLVKWTPDSITILRQGSIVIDDITKE